MQSLTEKILQSELKNRIFSEFQLQKMLDGSPQSRYGLVNRALKAGEILRFHRSRYCLPNQLRDTPCHPFSIAQVLTPLSYVSFETALSWHRWIPEQVQVVSSVLPGRKKKFYELPQFGSYSFLSLALNKPNYLAGVRRHQVNKQTFLIAEPLRALLDLVCLRKMEWTGLEEITTGLRVDSSEILNLSADDFVEVEQVYKQARIRHFSEQLKQAVLAEAKND